MAKFLTEEWVDEAVAALRASPEVADASAGVSLVLQQIIGTPDGGEVRYWTALRDGAIDAGLGDAADADVTITQDYETAVAITKAETKAQAAFMQGKLKITGNMGKLLQHQKAMESLFPVLAQLPTEY